MGNQPAVSDLTAVILGQVQDLLSPDGCLLLAISGGADSMALWDLMARTGRWRLAVYHLDHGLRDESRHDGELIRRFAERTGGTAVDQVIIERSAIAELAAQWRCSQETAGRRQRYERLAYHARALGAQAVLTAHHRDDQSETVLANLLRGAGPLGSAGMPRRRRLARGIALVRPLLTLTRAQLREHCVVHGIAWNEDRSNADTTQRRNFLRHAVLPAFELGAPGISEELAALAGVKQRAVLDLNDVVEPAWRLALRADALFLDGVAVLSVGQRLGVWRRLLRHLGAPIARRHLRRLDDLAAGPAGRRLELGDWLLLRRPQAIAWERARPASSADCIEIGQAGMFSRGGDRLWCTIEPVPSSLQCAHHEALLALESCGWPLFWRRSLLNERWIPLGAPGRQTVVKFLSGRGVPSRLRVVTPVIADLAGVLWVPGHGIAERARVVATTREVVRLRWTPAVDTFSVSNSKDDSDERR